jgi:predicted nucleic acid-binding Zn ribbon protein
METKRKKNKDFMHISDILNKVVKTCRPETDEEMEGIWSLWKDVIGKTIAENAQPEALKGDILLVHVSSSVWMQQLRFLKKDIIDKINAASGKERIKEIKFKIGPI